MQHPDSASVTPMQRWLVRLAYGLAAAAGMVYGYDFGKVIGGPFVGVVLALNGAVFCSIVAGALAERLCRWWPQTLRETERSAG